MNNSTVSMEYSGLHSKAWIVATFAGVIQTGAVFLNILLMYVFVKSKNLHTLENSFLVNLVGFDLACALTSAGFLIYRFLSLMVPERITACFCLMILLVCVATGQFMAFLAMALDRYIKIVHPFTHSRICTKKYICLLLLSVHLVAVGATVAFTMHFTWDPKDACSYQYTFPTFIFIIYQLVVLTGLMVILLFNVKILLISKEHQKHIQVQTRSSSMIASSSISRSTKKVLGSLTLFTFITYLPNYALLVISAAGFNIRTPAFDFVTEIAAFLWNLGLLFDPLVFMLCRKDIKDCTTNLLKCSKRINVE